jgi:hypothetical protein
MRENDLEVILRRLHAYRMYREAPALTIEPEGKERNLANAERVRDQLKELIGRRWPLLSQPQRNLIDSEVAHLGERRAGLCAEALLEALSSMYRPHT